MTSSKKEQPSPNDVAEKIRSEIMEHFAEIAEKARKEETHDARWHAVYGAVLARIYMDAADTDGHNTALRNIRYMIGDAEAVANEEMELRSRPPDASAPSLKNR